MTTRHPFPYAPIHDLLGSPSLRHAARIIGCSRSTIQRWSVDGMTVAAADRVAIGLGVHPVELWPELWGAMEVAAT